MAVTLSTPVRQAATDAATALVNTGTANAQGKLLVRAGATVLCTINLNNPAFNVGVLPATLQGLPLQGTAGVAGTADNFAILDRDDIERWTGSLLEVGGDMTIDNDAVTVGATVTITAGTFQFPA